MLFLPARRWGRFQIIIEIGQELGACKYRGGKCSIARNEKRTLRSGKGINVMASCARNASLAIMYRKESDREHQMKKQVIFSFSVDDPIP